MDLKMYYYKLNINMSMLLKAIYRLNAIPMIFFCRNRKIHPEINIESQGILNSQKYLEKEQSWRSYTFWCQNLLQNIVIKTVWYWHKDRHIYQLTRVQSPKIKLCICGPEIFNKSSKRIHWGKNSLFNYWYWENWISTCKRIKMDPYLTTYIKINPN